MTLYIGIDWSESKHDVLFMDKEGKALSKLCFEQSAQGFQRLEQARRQLGVTAKECLIGVETSHNLLIDFLWGHGYDQVYVIGPHITKASRGRFGTSGAHNDASDGLLLADLVRTDRARLQLWRPDSLLTRQLRAQVGLVGDLSQEVQRHCNRLRSLLLRYYPAATVAFGKLTAKIALEFICSYPSPEAALALSYQEFAAFARVQRYPRPKLLPACFERLQAGHIQADSDTVAIYTYQAPIEAKLLLYLLEQKELALKQVQALFDSHPDRHIYAQLPGAGELLAPSLLAMLGDDRQRFPTKASLQALAGTCPVTQQSGKRKSVIFRHACDHESRTLAQEWALASVKSCGWAGAYYQQSRERGHSKSHALRCLANRWLAVLWALWQRRQAYDEGYHLAQRLERHRPLLAMPSH